MEQYEWECRIAIICIFRTKVHFSVGHQECSLVCPLTHAQRFKNSGHFSSQISLARSEQGADMVPPFILWHSHLTLYLFFLKKKKTNLKPIHCHKIFNKRVHFYKIQLNQKSFDGCSETVLLFSWRSSKGLKHSGFWNENCHLYSFWVIVEGTRIINWDAVLPPSATESEKKSYKIRSIFWLLRTEFSVSHKAGQTMPRKFPLLYLGH